MSRRYKDSPFDQYSVERKSAIIAGVLVVLLVVGVILIISGLTS